MTRFIYILLLILPCNAWGQRVVFSPQWSAQAQFAGYYVAKVKDFYKEAGLDVEIIHPTQTRNSIDMLNSGECDFITLSLLSALSEKIVNSPIVNIMQSSQTTGLTIISHNPLNNDLKNLEGKRIGKWKVGLSALAVTTLNNEGVSVDWIDHMSGEEVFLSGAVDATLAMSYNELLSCLETGHKLDKSEIIYLNELGHNIPEDGLYCLDTMDKDTSKRFVEASKRGWQWAYENRDETIDIVMDMLRNDKLPINRVHQKAMLDEILRLQKNARGERTMVLTPEDFERAIEILSQDQNKPQRLDFKSFIRE
ncbi:MAG: ABC transporter substrate-binding protein [Bacteroidales bacterium]